MLTILHGEDTTASYLRLQELLSGYSNIPKIRLSTENSDMLYQEIFGQDILGSQKVVIAQDLLSSKKIEAEYLKNIPETSAVFFWEKKELPQTLLKKMPPHANIQIFKPNPILFKLLDVIGVNQKLSLEFLQQLTDTRSGLTWHIENRLFLLILAKMGINSTDVGQISGKAMLDWQWGKIQNQARRVGLLDLKRLFASTLKLEMMIKSGLANQNEKNLISLMLLKHS